MDYEGFKHSITIRVASLAGRDEINQYLAGARKNNEEVLPASVYPEICFNKIRNEDANAMEIRLP